MQANVHITPMRASRALALRYLATKFSTDTENIAVSAFFPAAVCAKLAGKRRQLVWTNDPPHSTALDFNKHGLSVQSVYAWAKPLA